MFHIPSILVIRQCTVSHGLTHHLFSMDMFSCLTQKFPSWCFFFLICRNVQVFDQLLFPKASTYFNGIQNTKNISTFKKKKTQL